MQNSTPGKDVPEWSTYSVHFVYASCISSFHCLHEGSNESINNGALLRRAILQTSRPVLAVEGCRGLSWPQAHHPFLNLNPPLIVMQAGFKQRKPSFASTGFSFLCCTCANEQAAWNWQLPAFHWTVWMNHAAWSSHFLFDGGRVNNFISQYTYIIWIV